MNTRIEKPTKVARDRKNERGAALVTVMMISFLLLVASIALILESSLNTANVTDATSEEQAYYAAESGIQSVVDALRHNAVPVPLVNPAATPLPSGEPNAINRLDYRKAVDRRYSNATCDPSASIPTVDCGDPRDSAANRMSRWMRYSWGPNGGTEDPSPDRIVLGDPATYSPLTGFAYSVEVSDPDNTASTVTFSVANGSGIDMGTGQYALTRTFPGAGADQNTTVEYIPPAVQPQTINVESGTGMADLGSFRYTNGTAGPGIIPGGDAMVRFKITLTFTQPANGFVVLRGYILPPGGALRSDDSTTCARPTLSFLFDSQNYRNFGSLQSIRTDGCMIQEAPPTANGPYATYLTGYQVQPAPATQPKRIDLNISQPEPRRLLIRSMGYGPRGARKQFESIIQKNYFDGMGAPSPLTMIGPPCTRQTASACTAMTGLPVGTTGVVNGQTTQTQIKFTPGTSNPIEYTGRDESYGLFQPPIGVTNDPNLAYVRYVIANAFGGRVFGTPENIAAELPPWLQNPRNLDRTIQLLREVAQASGTYYATSPPNTTVFGDWTSGTGITVIDAPGGAELNHQAGGLLVVTNGALTLRGQYAFKGVMVLTGPGGLYRAGGGGGNCTGPCGRLEGNMIVAPYNTWSLNTCMPDTTTPQYQDKLNCFMSPQYEISGGGNSDLMGNGQSVGSSLNGLGNFVKGVVEK